MVYKVVIRVDCCIRTGVSVLVDMLNSRDVMPHKSIHLSLIESTFTGQIAVRNGTIKTTTLDRELFFYFHFECIAMPPSL